MNNPHSHLKQKVGLIEPSSRAKNAKMFESCRYDFPEFHRRFPHFTIHLHHGLHGGSEWHCLGLPCPNAPDMQPPVRVKNLPESNHPQENGGEMKCPHGKAGLFPVVGPCACFGAWGHVRHLANHCSTTPTTSPDSAFKHWVLKEFSCQVSRLNPAMHVDVRGVSQNQTPLR